LSNRVWTAHINPNHTLQPWVATTPLPQPVCQHAAVSGSGRVYVLGGLDAAGAVPLVVSAPLVSQGLGSWSTEPQLPNPLYLHAAAVTGGRLYVTGGSTDTTWQD